MMPESERRSAERRGERGAVFLEVLASSDRQGLHDRILISNILDISANGLRVALDRELEVGTILQLAVKLGKLDTAMYLVGEVRWCMPVTQGNGYEAGFELFESEGTDLQTWRALVQAIYRS